MLCTKVKMKNKSLFASIVVFLSLILGLGDMLIGILGREAGLVTMAILTLGYQICILIWKTLYDTGNWMKGWKFATIAVNVLTFIPLAIGVFGTWASDSGLLFLGPNFLVITSKIIAGSNLVILLLNTDWKTLMENYKLPDTPGRNI